jgi:hypothetical protein
MGAQRLLSSTKQVAVCCTCALTMFRNWDQRIWQSIPTFWRCRWVTEVNTKYLWRKLKMRLLTSSDIEVLTYHGATELLLMWSFAHSHARFFASWFVAPITYYRAMMIAKRFAKTEEGKMMIDRHSLPSSCSSTPPCSSTASYCDILQRVIIYPVRSRVYLLSCHRWSY